ncbi:MAG: 50S ribosomal protein L11 methyltransferase [Methylophilaceae bacterium]|jgi:ribosomal protein L11 methyltransferase|nr:50S ribosomal protein L11 methyltransferase [Methylophilaceae bacterium]MDG1453606.1 50S ribosomal protein L11 methyltransferase [Methylophilaceae bacterium]
MAWLLLKIQANDQNADTISDALMALGALSASIEDAHAETVAEQAIFGEPGDPPPGIWQQNIVTAMLDESADIPQLLQALQDETQIPQFSYVTETIEEQDWVRATQAQFDPIHITDNLWIVPTWHTSPNENAINIILDPGLAFGTGSHPTTHLCLEWLTQQVSLGDVLDYGCGSGILAIAAKKLGSKTTVGVDIDDQAVTASRFNSEQNDTQDIAFYDANDFGNQTFDIVVANILSSALMVLAPALAKYCKTGGKIALSGILEEQTEALLDRYSEWFTMDTPTQKDAWILLTGIKK